MLNVGKLFTGRVIVDASHLSSNPILLYRALVVAALEHAETKADIDLKANPFCFFNLSS
jgi:hypothetical protein